MTIEREKVALTGTELGQLQTDLNGGDGIIAKRLDGPANTRVAALEAGVGIPSLPARAPTAKDDTTRGYAVGSYWRQGDTMFVSRDVTAGAAIWAPIITDRTPVCNAVPGAVAAYGTILLNSAYTGAAINVVRASDSTALDIGFVQIGKQKVLDELALDAFLAGTTGSVATLYDQSGNGNHATQATAANRPIIGRKMIGGVRVITFLGDTGDGTIHFLTLPVGVSVPRNANSQYAAITPMTSVLQNAWWEIGTVSTLETLIYQDNSASVNRIQAQNSSARLYFPARTDPSIFAYITDGSTSTVTQNNAIASAGGGGTGTIAGGQIGNTIRAANYQGRFDLGALIVYGTKHNAATQEAVMSRLYRSFGVAPQSDVNIPYAGDSITYGRTVVTGNERAAQLPLTTGEQYARFNYGIGGRAQSSLTNAYPNEAAQIYDPKKLNIIVLFAGTNDLKANLTGAATWASAVTMMQAARTTGFKILIATMLQRGDFTGAQEAERVTFNSLVRANWQTYADGLLDYAADPIIGTPTFVTSNTVLFADGVHPTEYGDSILASYDAKEISRLVRAYRLALT